MEDIIIIGGGLAGLSGSIQLAKLGFKALVIEKRTYPFQRVCGEYISNEVRPFLGSIGVFPEALGAASITKLQVSSPKGKILELPLDLGGFGLSRFRFDAHLYEIAKSLGVDFLLNAQATDVSFNGESFTTHLQDGSCRESRLVIGCYGKRSNLDRQLNRAFFKKKSPYIGVKYHIRTDHPADLISLHNFKDGYCGLSRIEEEKYSLCYLSLSDNLKNYSSIQEMEAKVLSKNPYLKHIFDNSDFLFDKPETISEVSFEKKTTRENHILMAGDAVGMISPLCGNGMAMALNTGKMLAYVIAENWKDGILNRAKMEMGYEAAWTKAFERRLYVGRTIQKLFGNEIFTEVAVQTLSTFQPLGRWIVSQTHGKPF